MIAPRREYQQGLGHGVHRVIEHHGTQLFRQRRAARFARHSDHPALRAKGLRQSVDMSGLSGAVNAFEADE